MRKMIPLDLFAPELGVQQRFRDWAKEAIADQDERDSISDIVSLIRQKLAGFNLPFLSLPVTTKKQTALDVFIRMNTSAAPLLTYDVVVAQIEAGMGKSLHDLVADTKTVCPNIANYYAPEDLALYAGALLQGRAPTNATYLAKDFGPQLLSNWDKFLVGVSRTVDFLEQERIFDAARLPTDIIVPVLVALWAISPNMGDAEGRARTNLRKYLWRAFFSNRYEKSTNTRSLADFNELKPLVTGTSPAKPAIFDNDLHPLPQLEELIASGWPIRRERLSRAILALALKQGGLDLADGSTATRANLPKREYHHLFPVAHLARIGVSEENAYRSLNCALVTWKTNRTISDKEPEHYLAQRRDGSELGDAEVKSRLASHLIPDDEMVAGDYKGFLEKRAALIHAAITALCSN